jgi:ABC-type transporter MlaC component
MKRPFEFLVTRRGALAWPLAAVALGAFGAGSAARAASPAETFVQTNIDRSYAILSDRALNPSERRRRFHDQLLSMVDVKRVALFTLGLYARSAAQGALEKFELAFEDFLTEVYLRGLDSYTDLRITGSSERARDDVIVSVAASDASGKSSQLNIAFRVRRANDGRPIIIDLQIEGAWLALVQRSEFIAYLQQHGGDVAELSTEIEQRADRLRVARSESEIHRRGQ